MDDVVKQCKSCPWRIDCIPDRDIPNYRRGLHEGLTNTIAKGDGSDFFKALSCSTQHAMACHYSKPGEEFPCAGWLSNQLGPGNNIGVRLAVMTGRMPRPEIDGPQHETFEQTLCNQPSPSETRTASSTRSRKTGASARGGRSAASSRQTNSQKTRRRRA